MIFLDNSFQFTESILGSMRCFMRVMGSGL